MQWLQNYFSFLFFSFYSTCLWHVQLTSCQKGRTSTVLGQEPAQPTPDLSRLKIKYFNPNRRPAWNSVGVLPSPRVHGAPLPSSLAWWGDPLATRYRSEYKLTPSLFPETLNLENPFLSPTGPQGVTHVLSVFLGRTPATCLMECPSGARACCRRRPQSPRHIPEWAPTWGVVLSPVIGCRTNVRARTTLAGHVEGCFHGPHRLWHRQEVLGPKHYEGVRQLPAPPPQAAASSHGRAQHLWWPHSGWLWFQWGYPGPGSLGPVQLVMQGRQALHHHAWHRQTMTASQGNYDFRALDNVGAYPSQYRARFGFLELCVSRGS